MLLVFMISYLESEYHVNSSNISWICLVQQFSKERHVSFRDLKLKEPVYQKTAVYGHFGRSEFTWEQAKTLKF